MIQTFCPEYGMKVICGDARDKELLYVGDLVEGHCNSYICISGLALHV